MKKHTIFSISFSLLLIAPISIVNVHAFLKNPGKEQYSEVDEVLQEVKGNVNIYQGDSLSAVC